MRRIDGRRAGPPDAPDKGLCHRRAHLGQELPRGFVELEATLPVKPSVTTTRAVPRGMSRPSTLPMNPGLPQEGRGLLDSSLPRPSSSPIDNRPTFGAGSPSTLRKQATHDRELLEVFRSGVGVGAGVEQHDEAGAAGQDDGDARTLHARDAAHVQGGGRHHRAGMPQRHGALGLPSRTV